ncbi:lipopolysaccharide assembly protein LapA domain-containing protein [Calothrix sp. 336/3]|uniref:lipopolysaccharide assembly protein LapA domain-containing protein n=1 Tax=Calothrix sp. 336/3 TaxID=1337936 RepID=UPI0004E343B9|nr:LapA family protein [Calothrix sp. 336/3]AKG23469.1 hypothetical protein IJ00_21270 [Calothrix sp. 336/3]
MKTLANLLTSIILGFWVMAIAIISAQNAEPVSLRFLTFQSIQIPFGLILAVSAAVGMIGISLLQPLWGLAGTERNHNSSNEDAEFFLDNEDF